MKKIFGVACAVVFLGGGSAFAENDERDGRGDDFRFGRARLATAAIPCVSEGLRFSCSNKSAHRALEVVGAKCIIGAGENPEVQEVFDFRIRVAPETTAVAVVDCPAQPVPAFCVAQVSPRQNARCAVTSPAGGLNSELD